MIGATETVAAAGGMNWGALLIPILVLLVALSFLFVMKIVASRYKKIPPNSVAIFYGRKYRHKGPDGSVQSAGFRVVSGGGSLLIPIVEEVQLMSTAAFQVFIDEKSIPNKDNVKINVKGVATCKISTAWEDLFSAAKAFLGKTHEEIEVFVKNILQGHLRSIIGKLDISTILRERDKFNSQVVEESSEELKRLGMQVITLVIQDVNDEYGYIEALGRQVVAEAVRDANIKVAEAERDTKKKTSDASREAAIVTASNEVAIAEANRDRDVKKAQFKVVADTEAAKANQALDIATAQQEMILRVKQAERDAAEREAQIVVQEKEAARKQKELEATVVRPAEAQREKVVIEAEAEKRVVILNAEAEKESIVVRAEGEKTSNTLMGEGEAARTKATLFAIAEGEAAKKRQLLIAEAEGQAAMKGKVLLAEAEGKKQILLAEAEGQAAMKGKVLLAEAEGTARLAEALAKMTTDAKLILILDRLPMLFDKGGEAASRVMTSIFASVAAPLGNIDELRIIDVGGQGRGIDQLASLVPNTVFKFFATAKAQGIDLEPIMKKMGIDIAELVKMVDGEKHVVPLSAPVSESLEPKPETE